MADVTQDPEAWARLGAKIRERRESMGLSRRQLSVEAGVSEKSIQVAEEGRTPRARWPQSLRLIENALRWEPGSMSRILEGGAPGEVFDSLSLFEVDAGQPVAGQAEQEFLAAAYARSRALAEFPRFLRKPLRTVLEFGHRAAGFGADEEAVMRYEEALEALLVDMVSRRLEFHGYSPEQRSGSILLWREAMQMDPVLRRDQEDELNMMDRKSKRIRETLQSNPELPRTYRTRVVGEEPSGELVDEVRRLADEVSRLARKVDNETPSGGDA